MRTNDTLFLATLTFSALATFAAPATAQTFTWPISGTSTPDEMNTSFGPRIEDNAWDFHDGMDLPAPCDLTTDQQTTGDTVVRAVTDGTIVAAGTAGQNGMSSRHVILQMNDSQGRQLRWVYLHLKKIDAAYDPTLVTLPKAVTRGTPLGLVGKDGAVTCHLHLELRRGGNTQIYSIHPLNYLPYTNSANWVAPVAANARFGIDANGSRTARLTFSAPSKLEGDLVSVEVDLRDANGTVLGTRRVHFEDKTTISEGSDDGVMFTNDTAIEGYQAPDMIGDGRSDLHYGVIVRNLPSNVASLVARIYDLGGLRATSAAIAIPSLTYASFSPDLSGAPFPPAGWSLVTAGGASVTAASNKLTATDNVTSGTTTQRAAIEVALPAGRFGWYAEANIKPSNLNIPSGSAAQFLFFGLDATNLAAAARVRASNMAGMNARSAAGTVNGKDVVAVASGASRKWGLRLTRVGTREATVVLLLDDVEVSRLNYNALNAEPTRFRGGLGASSPNATATIEQDTIRVNELAP